MIRRRAHAVVLCAVATLGVIVAAGCGYTTRSMIVNQYRTIYVAPFENKIDFTHEGSVGNKYRLYRPMLDSEVTRAVNHQYLFDGNLKPLTQESADLSLKGEVIEFRKDPLRYTDNDEVEEYRISIRVNVSLVNAKTNATLWKENNFTGDTTYFVRGPEATSEDAAVIAATNDLARRIVERTTEEW